jgi:hypothetical protein
LVRLLRRIQWDVLWIGGMMDMPPMTVQTLALQFHAHFASGKETAHEVPYHTARDIRPFVLGRLERFIFVPRSPVTGFLLIIER